MKGNAVLADARIRGDSTVKGMGSYSSRIRRTAALAILASVILAACGIAIDSHITFDEKCPLCQLRMNVLGIQDDSVPVPIPCLCEQALTDRKVSMPPDPVVLTEASRSPPFITIQFLS